MMVKVYACLTNESVARRTVDAGRVNRPVSSRVFHLATNYGEKH